MPAPVEIGLSSETIAAIRKIPRFNASGYRTLDIDLTLDFYNRRYIEQLTKFVEITDRTVIADVGTGFGWLVIALAMKTPAKVIAVDLDAHRLDAAREIATVVGVAHRIDWRQGSVTSLPLDDQETGVTYCIEVLEHVARDEKALSELARVTAQDIILTTPNLWFPIIAHDTQLPFCHWLPLSMRQVYANICGRGNRENDNLFWSPLSLQAGLRDFELISGFLHYQSFADYAATFPIYIPYGTGEQRSSMGHFAAAYYRFASFLGRRSQYVMPNLAAVYRRRHSATCGT
jgi:SAM-dependent methyltransferase